MQSSRAAAATQEILLRVRIRSSLIGVALLATACLGPASGPASCPQGAGPDVAPPDGLAPGDASRGAELFAANCTRCHSHDVADRESSVFRGYPRLDCGDWVSETSDAYLFRIISEGGVPFGRDKLMKPFAQQLSTQEISDLVAYLRAFAP